MRIPKEFIIKGKLWSVEYKWNLTDKDPGGPPQRMDGLCVVSRRVIQLDRALPKEEKWPVFLHEYVHAVLFEAHISGLDGPAGDYIEEVICEALADAFVTSFHVRWKRKR